MGQKENGRNNDVTVRWGSTVKIIIIILIVIVILIIITILITN